MDGWKEGKKDVCMNEWTDGKVGGWVAGWPRGWDGGDNQISLRFETHKKT